MPTADGWPAIVTAAGAATRFRPLSYAIPKELLPLGERPAVEHVVDECLRAGASTVTVVTRPGDMVLPSYLARRTAAGDPVRTVEEDLSHGYGNAAPILTLQHELRQAEAFMVAFGDDVVLGGNDLAVMARTMHTGAEAVIAGTLVDRPEARHFGIIDTHPADPNRLAGLRQRPHPDTVTEPLAVVSRLILRPTIFDHIDTTGTTGETDLGTAVDHLAQEHDVAVHRLGGEWVTVGDPTRYAHALNRYWRHTTAPAHH
ncbi:NTP transferase domain-containing protein [Streptomyces sp. AV19]|uniref:sugar phosphate nucleotidyltransferase n=1 Tax=Streptomyces sp. AV19 TaxID=2793068 RepID=UPI0018FEBAE6|nr:sugar phosphate nucleotidyltransferase [Streptomyces sp. AV19]MBH1939215.1 NTP transferase domain-containing protein [Streptomyces sp. AV19]MDG4537203.1 sugar phosphate nucleotidyltransferase [Streptomyces sp. AV19]